MHASLLLEEHMNKMQYYTWVTFVAWSALIATLCGWYSLTHRAGYYEGARQQARTTFEKDLLYLRWNAFLARDHVPNSYAPDRDLTIDAGRASPVAGPATTTDTSHRLRPKEAGIRSHFPSLNLLNPENAPDAWEEQALQAFREGQAEVSAVEQIAGRPYLRLMRPVYVEQDC